jgi:hypothetical protein
MTPSAVQPFVLKRGIRFIVIPPPYYRLVGLKPLRGCNGLKINPRVIRPDDMKLNFGFAKNEAAIFSV